MNRQTKLINEGVVLRSFSPPLMASSSSSGKKVPSPSTSSTQPTTLDTKEATQQISSEIKKLKFHNIKTTARDYGLEDPKLIKQIVKLHKKLEVRVIILHRNAWVYWLILHH
jgi:hypothetical protein